MDEPPKGRWWHTIAASLVSVFGFLILVTFLVYFVVPIAESLLNLYGRYFVPARFGGGSDPSPGLLRPLIRDVLVSGFSAVCALYAVFYLFAQANPKVVAAVFGAFIVAVGSLPVIAGILAGQLLMPLLTVGIDMVPPLVVAYWVWHGKLAP